MQNEKALTGDVNTACWL